MARINSRSKGQRGEREVAALLQPIIEEEWNRARLENPPENGGLNDPGKGGTKIPANPPILSRNLVQTRNGGHDLVGLDWLALEVKFCETLQLDSWWAQAKRQALAHANVVNHPVMPVLIYRQTRRPWRIQMMGNLKGLAVPVRVDISLAAFTAYFRAECRKHFAIPQA